MRHTVIKCLPKSGDLAEVKNWRPISLLNADYKIIGKCLANRISKFLPFVVSTDQTAAVKGRKISHNIRKLRDFVFYADTKQLNAFILSIDQMKAFDKVNWSFLFATLETLNFPCYIIKWVQILYTDFTACVNINGFFGPSFKPSQGVRQGCPLSPTLYTLFSEIQHFKCCILLYAAQKCLTCYTYSDR